MFIYHGRRKLTPHEYAVIHHCFGDVIMPKKSSEYTSPSSKHGIVQLKSTLRDCVAIMKNFFKEMEKSYDSNIQASCHNIGELVAKMEDFISAHGELCHQTDFKPSGRITVYDCTRLDTTLEMLLSFEMSWLAVCNNMEKGTRTWIFVDDFYYIAKNENILCYISMLQRRLRPYGAQMCIATQAVNDMFDSDYAKSIMSNVSFITAFCMGSKNERLSRLLDYLGLPDDEKSEIADTAIHSGDGFFVSKNSMCLFKRD